MRSSVTNDVIMKQKMQYLGGEIAVGKQKCGTPKLCGGATHTHTASVPHYISLRQNFLILNTALARAVPAQLHALRHRATHDRRSSHAERPLEEPRIFWNADLPPPPKFLSIRK